MFVVPRAFVIVQGDPAESVRGGCGRVWMPHILVSAGAPHPHPGDDWRALKVFLRPLA